MDAQGLSDSVNDSAHGEVRAELARRMVQLHRRYFGRGATQAKAFFCHEDLIVVELRDIFLTVEHTLVARGQADAVRATRQTFQSAMRDEFVAAVEEITGRRVRNYESVVFTFPPSAIEIFALEPVDERQGRLDREEQEDLGNMDRPDGGLREPIPDGYE